LLALVSFWVADNAVGASGFSGPEEGDAPRTEVVLLSVRYRDQIYDQIHKPLRPPLPPPEPCCSPGHAPTLEPHPTPGEARHATLAAAPLYAFMSLQLYPPLRAPTRPHRRGPRACAKRRPLRPGTRPPPGTANVARGQGFLPYDFPSQRDIPC